MCWIAKRSMVVCVVQFCFKDIFIVDRLCAYVYDLLEFEKSLNVVGKSVF